jgi:predicted nucleotidyltransferase component of viral defense system
MDRSKNLIEFIHNDPNYFRTALLQVAQESGFQADLIEKDYYNSLILKYLFQDQNINLVFKGGTCLSKVYAGFYRMSEDLDFVIPVESNVSKSIRRKLIKPVKVLLSDLEDEYGCLTYETELKGYNLCKQYIGMIIYDSVVSYKSGNIKIEIGMREQVLKDPIWQSTSTLLIDPFSERKVLPDFATQCLSIDELYAEKFRAALSRREPAIRDYFDIFYAIQNLDIDFNSKEFLNLVKEKLLIPGNDPIQIEDLKKKQLQDQIKTELKPVLRDRDYQQFDFEEVYKLVKQVGSKVIEF